MTITEAIALMEKIEREHGNIEVFFDCPKCLASFTPTSVATQAVHIKAAAKDSAAKPLSEG